jgi:hypothetical protein
MRDGQQPEVRPSVLCSPRSPNKPRECTGKCRQFNGFGLVQTGSGPGGRWLKSTRSDQLFYNQLFTGTQIAVECLVAHQEVGHTLIRAWHPNGSFSQLTATTQSRIHRADVVSGCNETPRWTGWVYEIQAGRVSGCRDQIRRQIESHFQTPKFFHDWDDLQVGVHMLSVEFSACGDENDGCRYFNLSYPDLAAMRMSGSTTHSKKSKGRSSGSRL